MDIAPAAHRFDQTTLGRLGFGASTLGTLYRPMSDAAAAATVHAALDAGVTSFDVATNYGFGLPYKRLGAGLAEAEPQAKTIVPPKVGSTEGESGGHECGRS